MVNRAKDYINAGDIFQVVPSQRFSIPFDLPPMALYRSLRRLNPSPYLFFFDFDEFSIVGSSPEILVTLRDGTVTLRHSLAHEKEAQTRKKIELLQRNY